MNIHFIAIGGAIMHQLALALLRQGHQITGSDDAISDPARSNLQQAGILPVATGWFPEKITPQLDSIVLGMHARADNPELLQAIALGIPVHSFPGYIYEVCAAKQRVVVAGSHGKTTITSMIMHLLRQEHRVFDYLVGASVAGFDQSVQLSDAPLIILEGDEYPASAIEKKPKIFFYHPHISVLSGIAWDHINVFPTFENYCSQFAQYLTGMATGATLFYNAEDEAVVRIVQQYGNHLHTIPYHMPAYRYDKGKTILDTAYGEITTAVFGSHNLLNMEAAVAVGQALGISREAGYHALASFSGAAKRLEKIHETENLVAYRDFAHAPSKLRATIRAVQEVWPAHKLIACFELHTFSSLSEDFLGEYKHSMDDADEAIVYFSRHALALKQLPPLQTEVVKKHFGNDKLTVISDPTELTTAITSSLQHHTQPVCLLLMSSGTFDGIDWNTLCSHRF